MERKPAAAPWLAYASALVLALVVLQALPASTRSPPREAAASRWVRWVAPSTPAASRDHSIDQAARSIADGARRFTRWASALEWEQGAKKYMDAVTRAQAQAWARSPAGEPVAAPLRQRQDGALDQAMARKYFGLHIVAAPDSPRALNKDETIKAVVRGTSLLLRNGKPPLVGPLQPADGRVELGTVQPGWFFDSRITKTAVFDPAAAPEGGAPQPVALEAQDPALPRLVLHVTRQPFDLRAHSRGTRDRPERQPVPEGRITSSSSSLALEELRAAEHLTFQPEERFLSLLFIGRSALADRVWCEREDTGERVGAYSSEFALLAVSAHAWSALHCHLYAAQPAQPLSYRVMAISARDEPGRELVLAFIGSELESLAAEGTRLPAPAQARVVEWLVQALGAQFREADIDTAASPATKAALTHLVKVSAAAAPAPASGAVR
jgi:hypothetical protein